MHTRERVTRIILLILSRPKHFTRQALATRFNVSRSTIDDDIREIKRAGVDLTQDPSDHKCSIIPDNHFKELQYLMPLTPEDQYRISRAIDDAIVNNKEASYLKKKFYSLYDFQRLGIRALRRPELEKLDSLEAAKKDKRQVILEKYRSNSNQTRDRRVEPFHIDTEQGTLQAFDAEDEAIRHFKLNRIDRVEITDNVWVFENRHFIKYTDVFRIADNQTESVHLELDVFAYNALVENYPQALAYTLNAKQPHTFNFQAKVNAGFLGLTNFIMGNGEHVKIIGPDKLKTHIVQEARKIIENVGE